MADRKISVESMVNHQIGFTMPGSSIQKVWSKRGSKLSFNYDDLLEAYSIPGVEYFFKTGMLYTDDMEFKREVGLEPEDAEEPVNVVKLDEGFMKRMVGPMPLSEFNEQMKKLSYDQRQSLVDYIVDHPNELKMEKVDTINKACNVNILRALELDKAAKEE